MFMKISHNRLKNRQNVAKMLCGTPKTRRFSAFLSHFSKIIFEKGLFRQSQRFALGAWGGSVDSPSKRKKLKEAKKAKITRCVPQVACTLCWALAHIDFSLWFIHDQLISCIEDNSISQAMHTCFYFIKVSAFF